MIPTVLFSKTDSLSSKWIVVSVAGVLYILVQVNAPVHPSNGENLQLSSAKIKEERNSVSEKEKAPYN